MPSRIMTAQQAYQEYGAQYTSMEMRGNEVVLRNSAGKRIIVNKNDRVYHRGHGRFGVYSQARDFARPRKTSRPRTYAGRVGSGGYRHTEI